MLNHVTLEVPARLMEREIRWWRRLGWREEASYSPKYGARWIWAIHEGTRSQIHLFPVGGDTPGGVADGDVAIVPRYGHVAVVVGEASLWALVNDGLPFEEGTRYWGTRRVMIESPAGHRVELMETGPTPAAERS